MRRIADKLLGNSRAALNEARQSYGISRGAK